MRGYINGKKNKELGKCSSFEHTHLVLILAYTLILSLVKIYLLRIANILRDYMGNCIKESFVIVQERNSLDQWN
jgi:hypothetical protein